MKLKLLKLGDPGDQGEKRTRPERRRAQADQGDRRTDTRSAQARPNPNPNPEQLTYAEACAKFPGVTIWPFGAPVHGIAGLTHRADWRKPDDDQAQASAAQVDQASADQDDDQADQDQDQDQEEIIGPEILLEMVTHETALPKGRAVVQKVLITHPERGALTLRMIEYQGGYLIGVIDKSKKAIGGACEFHQDGTAAQAAWADWLTLFGHYRH